ncbi:MAG: phosphatidylserine decarboxylase [Oscillospiraceae bacterium]|nr:phosphatidylserine decarboxylase [Oscillospiraceae bacterium]
MKIYDRKSGVYTEEKEYGKKKLEFLYNTLLGRILLKLVFARKYYSVINGIFMKSKSSVKKIAPFLEEYSISLEDCEKTEFASFDDFFTRKKKRYFSSESEERLISPADGRLSVFEINEDLTLKIKNSIYTLEELTGNNADLSPYKGGICLVYRLAVEDHHRYVFVDDGVVRDTKIIKGELHTVRPISEKYRVFSRNHRVCTIMDTKHFGRMIQIEVGALQVGKINNHPVKSFRRLDEKGYFSYGGSTIIQIFGKDSVEIDSDITEKDCEVLVRTGEGIGTKKEVL